MNAKNEVAEKLARSEQQKLAGRVWGKTFGVLLVIWSLLSIPPFFIWGSDHLGEAEPVAGAAVTIYAGGIGVLVAISAWRTRRKMNAEKQR